MILNRNESEVTTLGDVQKFKVGIDERNINHIVTILSSNLYSHPMQSFLRETISNAIDSHLEAGVNEPIIITITDTDLSIRDFGTGISPERFEEIYTNIGSSTKRQSNEYIGSFGIGRFSCLSVSDLANITSFYEGKAYYYVMNKDIDQLHIDLLFEKDTDEHNGVEVKIPFTQPLKEEDWRSLGFIKNIYIEDERHYVEPDAIATAFNKRKVYQYKTFKVLEIGYPFYKTASTYTEVLIGNIPYRVDYSSLWDDERYDNWKSAFQSIYPCLNIGDVDITPNREGLLYSERTKNALRKAYNEAIDELVTMWDDACNTEYTNFCDFMYEIKDHYFNNLKLQGDIMVRLDEDLPYKIKFKGFPDYDYKILKGIVRTFLFHVTDYMIAKVYRGEWRKGRQVLHATVGEILSYCRDEETIVIAVPNAYGFSSKYIKGFISEKFKGKTVILVQIPYISLSKVKFFIRQLYGLTAMSNSSYIHLVICCLKETLKYLDAHVQKWDIINSEEYKQYKEDNKEDKVYIRDHAKITYHLYAPEMSGYTTQSGTPKGLLQILKSQYKGNQIVYTNLENPFIYGFREIGYPNLVIVAFSQANYALVQKGLFPDWIKPIESLYSADNRILRKIATLEYLRKTSDCAIVELPSAFPKPIRQLAYDLTKYFSKYPYKYSYNNAYDLLNVVPEEKYDLKILALYNQVKKYLEIYKKLNLSSTSKTSFFYYFLMKAKKFRLDYSYYKMIRHDIENITNAL